MYKILGADGREYGPVSADVLKQWMAQGRANGETRVLPEGTTEWKALREIPELAAGLPLSAPPMMLPTSPGETATPLPQDVLTRDYDIDIGGCFSRAWELLTGPKMWPVIGGVAVWLLIQAGLSGLAQIPFLGVLFTLASFVIGGPLMGGVYFFILRSLRGEAAQIDDIFAGFKRFLQLFLAQLITGLIVGMSAIPGVVAIVLGILPIANSNGEGGLAALGIGAIVLGAFLILIPVIYLSVSWCFTLPLVMDKHLDFWPAMEMSRKVVGKHFFMVLLLMIITGIVSSFGFVLCCVGLFFTVPLCFAITMSAYERLFSQPSPTPTTTTSLEPRPYY